MIAWLPYCGPGPVPAELWTRWNLDPLLLATLALGLGGGWLWSRSRGGDARGWALAGAVLAVSFISPLCALSSALFTARTLHHLLLILAAAPALAWALPRRCGHGGLLAATAIQTVAFWAWHAPGAYAAALSHDGVYWLMQASLFAPAVWFWASVRRSAFPAAAAALLFATVQMGLLGALLTFAPQPLYAPHLLTTGAWGLAPLEDQQIAGLIMWAPAAAAYLAAALAVIGRGLGRAPARA